MSKDEAIIQLANDLHTLMNLGAGVLLILVVFVAYTIARGR